MRMPGTSGGTGAARGVFAQAGAIGRQLVEIDTNMPVELHQCLRAGHSGARRHGWDGSLGAEPFSPASGLRL